jgi:Lon protease-like protein
MALPLEEVFEERYLITMANLLKTVQARFGVVLIERGHQLGAARRCPEKDPLASRRSDQHTAVGVERRHRVGDSDRWSG